MKTNQKRINLYLDSDLMEKIGKKAKESYLPKAAFIKQLLYVTLMTNENNTSINLNENGK
ncbi:MAG: ribbon-helix-helix domain-containing protein [Bacteroidales bacterium]|nr:ribbon-helix-helix domain-containing protein [Bacteroidales bacterium]